MAECYFAIRALARSSHGRASSKCCARHCFFSCFVEFNGAFVVIYLLWFLSIPEHIEFPSSGQISGLAPTASWGY